MNLDSLTNLLFSSSRQAPARTAQSPAKGFTGLLKSALSKGSGSLVAQVAELMLNSSASLLGSLPEDKPDQDASAMVRASMPRLPSRISLPMPQLPPAADQLQASGEAATGLAARAAQDPAGPAQAPAMAPADRQHLDGLATQAARRHGLDPNLVRAVITAESDWNPATTSHAGAMGLMQLMPETAGDLGVSDPYDPAQNIDGGARYLAMMLERFGGDRDKALAAYNWGPSNVARGGRLPSETRTYLERVARFHTLYAKGLDTRA